MVVVSWGGRALCAIGFHAPKYDSRMVPMRPLRLDLSSYAVTERGLVLMPKFEDVPQIGLQQRVACCRCGVELRRYHWDEEWDGKCL